MNKRKLKKLAKKKGLPMPLMTKPKFKFKDAGKFSYIKRLTGGQAKIAAKAPPPNKIDAKDFAVLREEKAKGRGMGLQDEKVKPGKVMNARVGKSIKKDPTKTVNPFEKKSSKFMERRKKLPSLKSAIGKGGRIGAAIAALGIAGAGAAKLGQTLGRKMSEKKDKKMGGGMMKKYNKGMTDKTFTDPKTAMIAHSLKTKDKITDRDREAATYLEKKGLPGVIKDGKINRSRKKMGGGMMQRPMGYKKGMTDKTFTDPKTAMIAHSMKTSDKIYKRDRVAAKILEKEAPKGMYSSIMSRKKAIDKLKASKKILGKMGGGMMQKPMGYNKGVMIKARGCKLGRTRPTKIT